MTRGLPESPWKQNRIERELRIRGRTTERGGDTDIADSLTLHTSAGAEVSGEHAGTGFRAALLVREGLDSGGLLHLVRDDLLSFDGSGVSPSGDGELVRGVHRPVLLRQSDLLNLVVESEWARDADQADVVLPPAVGLVLLVRDDPVDRVVSASLVEEDGSGVDVVRVAVSAENTAIVRFRFSRFGSGREGEGGMITRRSNERPSAPSAW